MLSSARTKNHLPATIRANRKPVTSTTLSSLLRKQAKFLASAFAAIGLMPALAAAIPAAPVMTLYKFNGPLEIPYYNIGKNGPGAKAGSLTQGTSIIPCLVIKNGRALTNGKGTPYVGFEIVVDSRKARDDSATRTFERARAAQKAKQVQNHHCPSSVRHVVSIKDFYDLSKAPFFDPAGSGSEKAASAESKGTLDEIVRRFHNSRQCAGVNARMTGRRARLASAWDNFSAKNTGKWDKTTLARAKHLDYAMRTAIYEGHLDRGCSAYGACERNVVLLSIRNRAVGQCVKRQGCRFGGDFQGVASKPNQYNIWDEFLTEISGLTACYLRTDLKNRDPYDRIQAMYTQNVGDGERILYGSEADLKAMFPGNSMSDLKQLRHYYHPPAMGKCFPQQNRIEYMSGAVATKGSDHALIANTRIKVGKKVGGGYQFQQFNYEQVGRDDDISIKNTYPGFIVDGRKVRLGGGGGCTAYGVSRRCSFKKVGRYRKTPSWLTAGKPLGLNCKVKDMGASCSGGGRNTSVTVGGSCDVEMMPVTGVR